MCAELEPGADFFASHNFARAIEEEEEFGKAAPDPDSDATFT
jgi:hypothetical protein